MTPEGAAFGQPAVEPVARSADTASRPPAEGTSKGGAAFWAAGATVLGAIGLGLWQRFRESGAGGEPKTSADQPPPQALREPADASESFTLQEYQAYYHPRHPAFHVQYLGGVVFFTRVPGANRNESVRSQNIVEGRWNTFTATSSDGLTTLAIPVTLWRQGSTLRGRWL